MKFIPQEKTIKLICPKDTIVGDVYQYNTSQSTETLLRVEFNDESDKVFFLILSNERNAQANLIWFAKTREGCFMRIDGELIMHIE